MRAAQEAGLLDPAWDPLDVLVLVNQIAMAWADKPGMADASDSGAVDGGSAARRAAVVAAVRRLFPPGGGTTASESRRRLRDGPAACVEAYAPPWDRADEEHAEGEPGVGGTAT
ncbi:hypothetical protein LO772_34915 [Yinghuangia sp. ASG 101]|uniref:hypothetical protein n=1 Tax=Yinghuangia sp. ASG 101 TaxID=2896848 RepID=UPI001E64E169|nr:hypothetical protein [Yinghuangia sp. ASG 101]UGQ11896.1 hypothetical protein LO772_34915 [Yinghuangia sp. ASG 101]